MTATLAVWSLYELFASWNLILFPAAANILTSITILWCKANVQDLGGSEMDYLLSGLFSFTSFFHSFFLLLFATNLWLIYYLSLVLVGILSMWSASKVAV
jgi:hypothetical protein